MNSTCNADMVLGHISEIMATIRKDGVIHHNGATKFLTEEELDAFNNNAVEYAKKLRGEVLISNCNPRTCASAIVYIASVTSGCNMTQEDVMKRSGTSASAIRQMYRKIKPLLFR